MLYKYNTSGDKDSVIYLNKIVRKVITLSLSYWNFRIYVSILRLQFHDRFIYPKCTTTWSAIETATYVYFRACKSRCAPHCRRHFRYDGVSTPFISRAILLHEEASTNVTSGFETGCVFVDRSLSAAYVEQTGH